jgi:CRP/FNR family transcriptional regulator
MSEPLACARCPVRDRAACASLDESERTELARSGRTRDLAAGEILFAAGDDNASCATLVSGALKIVSTDAEGEEHILSLIHPAGFAGELFAPLTDHDVVALADSRVCLFSRGQFEKTLGRFPQLGAALLRRAQDDLHETRRWLDLAQTGDARRKVGGALMAFAEAASDSPCHPAQRFDLPLSRAELASLLGLTIETVSRQITRFEREGAIRRHGKRGIELVDPAPLSGN